jgi:hypothetical protein
MRGSLVVMKGFMGWGMVGRFSLLRIAADASIIDLEDYAGLEGPNRYFKNKPGGLGQYYFGPLRDLGVLDYTSEGGGTIPGYDKKKGSALADTVSWSANVTGCHADWAAFHRTYWPSCGGTVNGMLAAPGCHAEPFQIGPCPICAPFWASCDQLIVHNGLTGGEVISTVPMLKLVELVGTTQ